MTELDQSEAQLTRKLRFTKFSGGQLRGSEGRANQQAGGEHRAGRQKLCDILLDVGDKGSVPEQHRKDAMPKPCADICSFGHTDPSSMNSRHKGNMFSGFAQAMKPRSLAGWKRTLHLPLWDKPDGSRSSKKGGLVEPAIGMPITKQGRHTRKRYLGRSDKVTFVRLSGGEGTDKRA